MFINCKNIEYVKKGVKGLNSIVKIYFVLYFVLIFFYDVCSYKIFVKFLYDNLFECFKNMIISIRIDVFINFVYVNV